MIDDDGAAGRQRHGVRERRLDLAFDLIAREQRHRFVIVVLELAQVVGHDPFHELLGLVVHGPVVDQDLAHVIGEIVTQRAQDGVAFLVDQERGGSRDHDLFDRLPHREQVVHVPLQFLGTATDASRAHDGAHALWHGQLRHGFAHDVAILAGDPARHPACLGVVGHQHQETSGETDIGCQRRALVAALFLFDLDDNVLALAQHLADGDAIAILGLPDEILRRNLLQRQKPVAVGAIVDERRLEAGFNPGNTTFVDIRFFLFAGRHLDVEVVEFLAIYQCYSQLFLLSCIYQHSFHWNLLGWVPRELPQSDRRAQAPPSGGST